MTLNCLIARRLYELRLDLSSQKILKMTDAFVQKGYVLVVVDYPGDKLSWVKVFAPNARIVLNPPPLDEEETH